MPFRLLLLILVSVSLSALAQLCLKIGVGASKASAASPLMAMLTSPLVIGGLALYGFGAIVWLFVLQRTALSVAYPFVGLGFVVTTVMGALVLGENVTTLRIAGTLLIVAGCVVVARSA